MRETAFHKLNSALQAKLGRGCDEQMEVLGQKHECVKLIGLTVLVAHLVATNNSAALGFRNRTRPCQAREVIK